MASIGHVAVGLAAARWYDGARAPRWRSMLGWSALSLLPDIDVVGFMRGVPYGAEWGHRGATHSLTMAAIGGVAVGLGARLFKRPLTRTMAFAIAVLASHGLLDTMTDGGLGIALLWPFSLTRFFAPWTPIPVAPIGLDFFTSDGLTIAAFEVVLFLPLWLYACGVRPRAAAIAVWLIALWLIGSPDAVRERIVGLALREHTQFSNGYSEDAFRAIAIGDAEDAVRRVLGEPLVESWFFPPPGLTSKSAMEISPRQLPRGCFGMRLKDGVVDETFQPELCSARGLGPGTTRTEVTRVLGQPSESCAEYTRGTRDGHFRLRMVCFLDGKVEAVFRRFGRSS